MYGWALLMMLGLPLALGSWWGLLIVLPSVAEVVARLLEKSNSLLGTSQGTRTTCAKSLSVGASCVVRLIRPTVPPKFAFGQDTQLVAGFRTQCYSAAKPAAVGPRSG